MSISNALHFYLTPSKRRLVDELAETDATFRQFILNGWQYIDNDPDVDQLMADWDNDPEFIPTDAQMAMLAASLAKGDKFRDAIKAFLSAPKKDRINGFLYWRLQQDTHNG